jgi:hypothetical protein
MEDISSVVGSVVLHVNVRPSRYRCLDGQVINVFSFEGAYFVHDGSQGSMCTYGTWELAPVSLAEASQAPAIASATAGPGRSLVLVGRRFGAPQGKVTLVGYSPAASGPVYQASVQSWAPARVSISLPALPQGQPYDVVLFSASGAVATALVQ